MKRKKQENKGFRDGISKEKLMKSMTDQDWEMVKYQKDLSAVDPGSVSYNLLLENDPLRRRIKIKQEAIDKRFLDIKNSVVRIERIKDQITSGVIYDELKPGVPASVKELEWELEYANNMKDALGKDMVVDVMQLRLEVEHYDGSKQIVMTTEEFEEYVKKVENRLKQLGYDLFTRKDSNQAA